MPVSRHHRLSVWCCLLLLALHVLSLATLGSTPRGVLLSDVLQGAAAVLAAVSCYVTSHRTRALERQLWFLMGCSFGLWAAAQAGWIYFEDLRHARPVPGPTDTLFFMAFAPAALAVFLTRESEAGKMDWQRALDFLQVGIVLSTAYLAVFYVQPYWGGGREALVHTQVHVLIVRNVLLTAAFFLRAALTRFASVRALFTRMGMVLAVFTVATASSNEVVYVRHLPAGSWADLAWSVPFLLAAVAASSWQTVEEPGPVPERVPGLRSLLATNLLPTLLPLLVLVIVYRIARFEPVLAAGAMAASLVCYGLRLIVTQHYQQQAAAALRTAEERFRVLFEHNPQPTWVHDWDTLRYLEVNEAAVQKYGYSRDEFLRMSLPDLRPPEDLPLLQAALRESHGGRYSGRARHRLKDGRLIEVEINARTIDFRGRKVGLVQAQDITERLRLEQQLRQAQKMEAIGTLAGGVAHDFNNLLTVITGYSQLLLDRVGQDETLAHEVRQIGEAAARAAALTQQLLAFSRQQVTQPRVLNLNGVVAGMDKLLRRLIGEDIELAVNLAPDLALVRADPGQIEQVIMNLAVNARDAMPQGGQLAFETANVTLDEAFCRHNLGARSGPHVMLAVCDNGVGMDADTQAHIFEPFFTTKKGSGTGLGLATVYGIAKQSGGYIGVESQPGRGTTFRLYLPRVESSQKVSDQAGPPSPAALRGSETILLVEDDDRLRRLARQILESNGYRVLDTGQAGEAENICRGHAGPIHLLLTDVIMPAINGQQLLQRLKPLRPQMKALYMSGYAGGALQQRGIQEAGAAFLAKPFTPVALAQKVREVLDSAPAPS